jgi:hypothetical protein
MIKRKKRTITPRDTLWCSAARASEHGATLALEALALRHRMSRGVTAPLFLLDHWWEVRFLHR